MRTYSNYNTKLRNKTRSKRRIMGGAASKNNAALKNGVASKNVLKPTSGRLTVVPQALLNSAIVLLFLEMLNNIKLYHWKTQSFSQHIATDKLHAELSKNVDQFIEVLSGKDETRIDILNTNIRLLDTNSVSDFKARIYEYRVFLKELSLKLDEKNDMDLLNIRDEMLTHINQFLYLLTLNK